MIYSSWDIEQNILKLVILGDFLPFYLPKKPKNEDFEKWKNLLEISSFYTCTKNHNHMMYGSMPRDIFLLYIHLYHKGRSWKIMLPEIYKVRQTEIFVILFLPFQPPNNLENQNFKIDKNTWRYHFKHFHHKRQPYDVWFLRYGVQRT